MIAIGHYASVNGALVVDFDCQQPLKSAQTFLVVSWLQIGH